MSDELLTYDDLAARWKIGPRQARNVAKSLGLIPIDMGYRTKRFRPADVARAEEKASGRPTRRQFAMQ